MKKFEVSSKPLRTAIWATDELIIVAGDDCKIRLFNFHTAQKLQEIEPHKDFVRRLAFSEKLQFLISISDDKTI